ncbi:MAG: hypothetical protein JW714_01095 [Candidatus Omnitrophica bacterium]|nr:hypothetical protein [Candidatus Omnitrophota bacterium]
MYDLNKNKGQSSLEFALVLICIVGALIAMRIYVVRALQGRFRQAADQIGEQYELGHTHGTLTTTINKQVRNEVESHVEIGSREGLHGYASRSREFIEHDDTTRTGTETVGE